MKCSQRTEEIEPIDEIRFHASAPQRVNVVRIRCIGHGRFAPGPCRISAAADTAISAGFLPLMPSTPIGQTSASSNACRHALLAVAFLEAAAFGHRADQAAIARIAAPQDAVTDIEVHRMAVRHDQVIAFRRHRCDFESRLGRLDGPHVGRYIAKNVAPTVDPANVAVEARTMRLTTAAPTWPAPKTAILKSGRRRAR